METGADIRRVTALRPAWRPALPAVRDGQEIPAMKQIRKAITRDAESSISMVRLPLLE